MALIACRECGGQISDQARSCPHCGIPIRPKSGCLYWIGCSSAAFVIVIGIALYNTDPTTPTTSQSPLPASAEAISPEPPPTENRISDATPSTPPPSRTDLPVSAAPTPEQEQSAEPRQSSKRVKVDRDDHLEQCRDMIHLALRDEGLEAHGILLRQPEPTIDGLQSVWTVGLLRFECRSRPTGTGGFNHWLFHKGNVIQMFPDLPGPAH